MNKWMIKKVKSSSYTEEDKKVYNETTKLMEECVDLLNTYIAQSKFHGNLDEFEIDDRERSYRKQDLETLKQIKQQIINLFENN